ncbi:MAG: hypothetical protein A2X08_01010 [Bacteroidetes bacterium GWA2_32_17]|nr:MAG: hypothetical protein A2X08_01010 [Bacteroidetes bacterium GWA2_32_17]
MLINSTFWAQNISFKYDSKYYFLGIKGDYLGLGYVKEKADSFPSEWFYEEDYYELYLLDSLFKLSNSNGDVKIKYTIINRGKGYHDIQVKYDLISEELNKFVVSFYQFRRSKFLTEEGYKIYTGRLKYCKIRRSTDEQIISFLAGAYFFYSYSKEGNYCIHMPNSFSKVLVIKKLLKKYGCKEIKYIINKEGTPYVHKLQFIPSENLKLVFDHEKEVEWNLKSRWNQLKQP